MIPAEHIVGVEGLTRDRDEPVTRERGRAMSVSRAAWVVFVGVMSGCGAAPPPQPEAGAPKTEASTPPPAAQAAPADKASQGATSAADTNTNSSPPAAGSTAAAAPSPSGNQGAKSSLPSGPLPDLAAWPGAPELEAGAKLIEKESWVEGRIKVEKAIPLLEAGGRLDALIAAHTLRGRACVKLNDARCAEKAFQKAVELWEMPGAADRLRATGSDDAKRAEHMARAFLGVGEALFSLAEQKRKELDAIRFPEYKGADSKEEVTRFADTKVAEWVTKKTAKVEEVERAYGRLLGVAPEPPPRFAVAGSARMAQLWGKFTAEFRAAPIPAGWKSNRFEELRQFYYAKMDAMSAPIKARAAEKYERCRALAVQAQQQDDYSRACEVWLQKNQPVSSASP
jgi:hypothetical protein